MGGKMKPFKIELTVTAVVMAEDESHAFEVAAQRHRDILGDVWVGLVSLSQAEPIPTLADLPKHWDGMCIPYNGDGNTRLSEILAPKEPE